MKMTS